MNVYLGCMTGRSMPFYQIQAHCSCSGIRYTVYHSIWAFFNDKLLPRCRLSCSVGHERKYTQNKLGGCQHNHKCKMPAVKQALGYFLNNWIEIGWSALCISLSHLECSFSFYSMPKRWCRQLWLWWKGQLVACKCKQLDKSWLTAQELAG